MGEYNTVEETGQPPALLLGQLGTGSGGHDSGDQKVDTESV